MPRISPLLVAFIVLFAGSMAFLLPRGSGMHHLFTGFALAILCLLTRWFTRQSGEPERPRSGRLIAVQLAACGAIVLLTGLDGTDYNRFAPVWLRVPHVWQSLRDAIGSVAGHHVPIDIVDGFACLTLYCVPVAIVLLALKVPLRDLGLGRFRQGSLASAVAWLVLPLSLFAWIVATGRMPVTLVLRVWVSNLLQNGFSEEFLFRGAILGRLSVLMTAERALYLQALLFGLWHFGYDFRVFKGDVVGTFAEIVSSQMAAGLAWGYVTQRTGNIAIASAFHLLDDSMSEVGF